MVSALYFNFYSSIVLISDPAGYITFDGNGRGDITKSHALHASVDDNMFSDHNNHLFPFVSRGQDW